MKKKITTLSLLLIFSFILILSSSSKVSAAIVNKPTNLNAKNVSAWHVIEGKKAYVYFHYKWQASYPEDLKPDTTKYNWWYKDFDSNDELYYDSVITSDYNYAGSTPVAKSAYNTSRFKHFTPFPSLYNSLVPLELRGKGSSTTYLENPDASKYKTLVFEKKYQIYNENGELTWTTDTDKISTVSGSTTLYNGVNISFNYDQTFIYSSGLFGWGSTSVPVVSASIQASGFNPYTMTSITYDFIKTEPNNRPYSNLHVSIYWEEEENYKANFYDDTYPAVLLSTTSFNYTNNPLKAPSYIPHKEGYVFVGWKERVVGWYGLPDMYLDVDFSKIHYSDVDYFAFWEVAPEHLRTITFITNGGEERDTITKIKAGTVPDPVGVTARKGYKFLGWYYDAELENEFDNTRALDDNIVLYAKWEKLIYVITFVMPEGNANFTYEHGDLIEPLKPSKDGFTFSGWYTNSTLSEEVDFLKLRATRNMTLYPKFTLIEERTVNFYVDETLVESKIILAGEKIEFITDPKKANSTFIGWYFSINGNDKADYNTRVFYDNIDLYARFEPTTQDIQGGDDGKIEDTNTDASSWSDAFNKIVDNTALLIFIVAGVIIISFISIPKHKKKKGRY